MRYARVDGVSLAYQTWGSGPASIVAVPPLAQNIELMWERPEYRAMLDRLGTFARVCHFDKRGTGASDRSAHMPTVDERVEDLRAILDHADIRRAYVLGVSEGGPVALAFAATYPQRVDGVVLVCSGARIRGDRTGGRTDTRWREAFIERWGTEESITLDAFAPSLAADPTYRAWEPRYERQSAGPAAIRELLEMIDEIDVRPLLASITAPVLLLHRRDDPVVPVQRAREVEKGVADARLVELDGADHMAHAGDVHAWLDHVEAFTTGSVRSGGPAPRAVAPRPQVRVLGGFGVTIGDRDVPISAWGSRQARQLCKRLAVAGGQPVPRDELVDMLWPGEVGAGRLSARLSVLLSHVRRVLGGGLVADRGAVALDLSSVQLDLGVVQQALVRGDDAAAVGSYTGPLLPEDPYEDWATEARERVRFAIVGAHRRLAAEAWEAADLEAVVAHMAAIIDLDPYDERAHEQLVRALTATGRRGDAARANGRYRRRMAELGVRPRDLLADLDGSKAG
ncbi:MAG: alpha/beta fold hydrolase [Actinomycetes bacterium]